MMLNSDDIQQMNHALCLVPQAVFPQFKFVVFKYFNMVERKI